MIDVGSLRVRPDQSVHVARLELVRVPRHRLEVADAEQADPGREDVAEGQRRQRGVTAGAAARDGEPRRVHVAAIGQEAGGRDAVVDVDDAPGAVERRPVGPPVPGAAAVVDVDDGDPAAGQELLARGRARSMRSRWGRHATGRPAAGARRPAATKPGLRGGVVERVGHPAVRPSGSGSPPGPIRPPDPARGRSSGGARRRRRGWPGRTGRAPSAPTASRRRPRPRPPPRTALRTPCTASSTSPTRSSGRTWNRWSRPPKRAVAASDAVGQEPVRRPPEDPGRVGELGLHRAERVERRAVEQAVEVPPAGSGRTRNGGRRRATTRAGRSIPPGRRRPGPARRSVPSAANSRGPQPRSVPGHVRVIPLEPGEPRAVG